MSEISIVCCAMGAMGECSTTSLHPCIACGAESQIATLADSTMDDDEATSIFTTGFIFMMLFPMWVVVRRTKFRHQIDQSHDQSQVAGGRRTIIANLGSAVIAGNIGSLEIITHNDISRAPRRDLPSLPKAMPARADNVFMNGGQVAILKNAGSLKMVST